MDQQTSTDLAAQAILSGDIDYCCFPCEQTFTLYEDVVEHVATRKHCDNFANSSYLEKFAADQIRKVKQWLYCEACNTVISSSRRVKEHVAEEVHKTNKITGPPQGTKMFRRVGDQVVYLDELVISAAAWNGIIEESCVLCDEDWEDVRGHVTSVRHAVAVIQSGAVDEGNTLCRKIDNWQHHCLICNITLPQEQLPGHFESKDHLNLEMKCRDAKRELEDNKQKCEENSGYSKRVDVQIDVNAGDKKATVELTSQVQAIVTCKSDEIFHQVSTISNSKLDDIVRHEPTVEISKTDDINDQETMVQIPKIHDKAIQKPTIQSSKLDAIVGQEQTVEKKDPAREEKEIKNLQTKLETTAESEQSNNVAQPRNVEKSTTNSDLQEKQKSETPKTQVKKVVVSNTDITLLSKRDNSKFAYSEYLWKDLNEELGLNNYMELENGRFYCILCNKHIHMEMFKHHINDWRHNLLTHFIKIDIEKLNDSILKKCRSQEDAQNHIGNTNKLEADNIVSSTSSIQISELSSHEDESIKEDKFEPKQPQSKAAKTKQMVKEVLPELTSEKELDQLYKLNHIIVKEKNVMCTLCNVEMAFITRSMDEHINGARHKRNASKPNRPVKDDIVRGKYNFEMEYLKTEKVPMDKYIVLFVAKNNYCVINNCLCIPIRSYCLTQLLECLICKVGLSGENKDLERHVNGEEHRKKMASIPVMTDIKSELVREIGPSQFHCGICHSVFDSWRNVRVHIDSDFEHLKKKMVLNSRLLFAEDISINADTLKFIRRVNESTERTYFT